MCDSVSLLKKKQKQKRRTRKEKDVSAIEYVHTLYCAGLEKMSSLKF